MFIEARKFDKGAKIIHDRVSYKGSTYSYSQAYELAQHLSYYNKGTRNDNNTTASVYIQ